MCAPWESNPQSFALLTQYSTTEPQEHVEVCYSILPPLNKKVFKRLHYQKSKNSYNPRTLKICNYTFWSKVEYLLSCTVPCYTFKTPLPKCMIGKLIRCIFCICIISWCSQFTQINSNHFYCHITTALWVQFLRACSRQCRNNWHIDSTYLQTYT